MPAEPENKDQNRTPSTPKGDPVVGADEWKELHAFYLDDAKERIGRTKTVLLVWIAALLTAWVSGIEQSRDDVADFLATRSAYIKAEDKARDPERRKEALIPPKSRSKSPAIPSPEAAETEKDSDRKDLETKATQAVNFELFGLKMPIPPLLASSVWLALLCCMFLKLLSDRWWIFRSLGRALRIERRHLMLRSRERVLDAPWWLAPLPRPNRAGYISRDDLQAALDWPSHPRRLVLLALSFVVMTLAVLEVLYANWQLLKHTSTLKAFTPQNFPAWQIQLGTWLPLILVVACIALVWKWCSAFEMPDFFPGEARSRMFSRRDVLVMGACLAAGSALYVFNPKIPWLQVVRRQSPRFGRNRDKLSKKLAQTRNRRLTRIPGVEPNSFYKNRLPPEVIRASNPAGAFRFPKKPQRHDFFEISRIAKIPANSMKATRIALREAGWALELKAIEALEQNNTGLACDLLLAAVRHDLLFLERDPRKPSYRLYDFLAGLSVRLNTEHFSSMRQLLEHSAVLPAFQYRIKTWEDPNSRWCRRWSGPNRVWITSIARTTKGKKEKAEFRAESEKKRLRLPM